MGTTTTRTITTSKTANLPFSSLFHRIWMLVLLTSLATFLVQHNFMIRSTSTLSSSSSVRGKEDLINKHHHDLVHISRSGTIGTKHASTPSSPLLPSPPPQAAAAGARRSISAIVAVSNKSAAGSGGDIPVVADTITIAATTTEKNANTNNNDNETAASAGMNILFVHVGKCGGETVKSLLRMGCRVRNSKARREACYSQFDDANESQLSRKVLGYMHYKRMTPQTAPELATHFLYVARHPVDRFVSWFKYVSPFNCDETSYKNGIGPKPLACRNRERIDEDGAGWHSQFFFTCFPNVETFAMALVKKRSNNNATIAGAQQQQNQSLSFSTASATTSASSSPHCQSMVRRVLQGQGPEDVVGHVRANYQFYVKYTHRRYPRKPVFVLRTEELWNDIKALEAQRLGGSPAAFAAQDGLKLAHGSETFRDQSVVSPTGAFMLCCALFKEFTVYHGLIRQAANLDDEQKQSTLQRAIQKCGFRTWTDLTRACGFRMQRLPNSMKS